ncbi:MAG: STAS domain-containing protein [Planctomycetota bacterium]
MGDLTIQLDRDSTPGIHRAVLAGPLDNRTADGFDEWLKKYSEHFGTEGTLHLDMDKLECLSSRAISSIVYYYDKFQQAGGKLHLVKVPPTAAVSLEKLGFGNLDLFDK